ncbi:MAG: NAD(P)-binding domain-containing protein, partial [Limisphaerales bacterium]
MTSVGIIGLGYVGLPLALHFARAGLVVTGLDMDAAKVARLNDGQSYIGHIPAAEIAREVTAGRLRATTDFAALAG